MRDFPGGASGKEPACHCRRCKRRGFDPWVRKILWRRAWQPTPETNQYSCLENPMDRGAWWATDHGITELNTSEWLTLWTLSLGLQLLKDSFWGGDWRGSPEMCFYFKNFSFTSTYTKILTWVHLPDFFFFLNFDKDSPWPNFSQTPQNPLLN